jgi:hypothetical protein
MIQPVHMYGYVKYQWHLIQENCLTRKLRRYQVLRKVVLWSTAPRGSLEYLLGGNKILSYELIGTAICDFDM